MVAIEVQTIWPYRVKQVKPRGFISDFNSSRAQYGLDLINYLVLHGCRVEIWILAYPFVQAIHLFHNSP